MQRIQWELRLVGLLTAAGLAGGTAFAETVELVTYYPSSATVGQVEANRLHAGRATVGDPYLVTNPADAVLPNGTLLVSNSVGIGPVFGTTPPAGALHVVGVANQPDRVLFMPGAGGTLNVGIGTANPQVPLQVGASNLFVQPDQGGSLEIGGTAAIANPTANGTPYIDFHFGTGAAQDFNARIINSGNNQLAIQTASGGSVLTVNGANVGIGNAYAPGAAVPNGQPGNLDVNDIFLRSANRWASQGGTGAIKAMAIYRNVKFSTTGATTYQSITVTHHLSSSLVNGTWAVPLLIRHTGVGWGADWNFWAGPVGSSSFQMTGDVGMHSVSVTSDFLVLFVDARTVSYDGAP